MWTILIAERDPSTVARVREALRHEPYRIITAENAEEALVLICRRTVDLLILDTETEGFAILEQREGLGRDLPVIMMGAAIPEEAIHRGWALGVDSSHSKNEGALPLLPAKICVKVQRIFEGKQRPNSLQRSHSQP
jgi:DNA-binding response OmpR family regulator